MSHNTINLPCDLKGFLSESVLVLPDESNAIKLIEEDPSANMQVQVIAAPSHVAMICLHRFNHFPFLEGANTKRKADYLLVLQQDDNVHAIFIELKVTLDNAGPYKQQLRRSLPFFEYLHSACEVHYDYYEREPGDYNTSVHYIIIAAKETNKFDKQRVKVRPSKWPEKESYKDIAIYKFVGLNFSFNQLASVCAAS